LIAFVFLRQSIRQQMGQATEFATSLHIFLASPDNEPKELGSEDRSRFVRACMNATRLRERILACPTDRLKEWEMNLALSLKRPTTEDIEGGIRHAVWPIAIVIVA